MDDEGHPTTGPGEFDEFCIGGHPRLERSAPQPWNDFPWGEVFQRLDGEPPEPPRRFEAVADALREILLWMVEPRTTRRVGLRALMLAWTLGRKDLLTSQQLRVLRNTRWKAKKKARAAKRP